MRSGRRPDPWREAWEASWRYVRIERAVYHALEFVPMRGQLDRKARHALAVRDHEGMSLRRRLRLRIWLRSKRGG